VHLRLAVIDDHPALLLGARAALESQPDMHVVATAAGVDDLLAQRVEVDIVLLDLVLGDGSRVADNVTRLRATGAPVLAYSGSDQPALLREAARAGASGVIRKTEPPEAIAAAVRTVAAGGVAAGADWAAALEDDHSFVSAKLSAREREVLALYAAGETAERVAAALFVSRETVVDHIRRIRAKYAAADRPARTKVDLYRRAVEDGLVDER
jgi:DNA-binding NarL/FixJ family response regulator